MTQEDLVRGFVYKKEDGSWILAEEPNLKSCCIGSEKNLDKQIALKGDFSNVLPHRAVTVSGKLKEEPLWNDAGQKVQHWVLVDGKIKETPFSYSSLFLALFACGIAILLLRQATKLLKKLALPDPHP
jgi:hypothetical protein